MRLLGLVPVPGSRCYKVKQDAKEPPDGLPRSKHIRGDFRQLLLNVLNGLKPKGSVQQIRFLSIEEANAPFVKKGWQAPYAGKEAVDFVTAKPVQFVRVHGENNKARSWMMREEDISGLTPGEIRDKFALPETPTFISTVEVPVGTGVRLGKVAPQAKWGRGGAWQFELQQRIPESAFTQTRPL